MQKRIFIIFYILFFLSHNNLQASVGVISSDQNTYNILINTGMEVYKIQYESDDLQNYIEQNQIHLVILSKSPSNQNEEILYHNIYEIAEKTPSQLYVINNGEASKYYFSSLYDDINLSEDSPENSSYTIKINPASLFGSNISHEDCITNDIHGWLYLSLIHNRSYYIENSLYNLTTIQKDIVTNNTRSYIIGMDSEGHFVVLESKSRNIISFFDDIISPLQELICMQNIFIHLSG
ncbi:MAG: hypothetical protein P857_1032 [Candidatus Xenolissoclinum pacificiensis L6]|uniref:Uncharacterized protein n=1 Tax=Candidatus Xenolissoclinum pacificiensis L6 TaxID=1401685 RepID=W2V0R7_9RICK|nr:MAG: hypothetical protein P857_1032 [Candidatus Xenolissoclinum pacificiensis L6]